jgi:uncharacterized protein YndB with AHSA1/START domain
MAEQAPTTPADIRREVRIQASPATVWAYFVDPDRIVRWMGKTAALDVRPGGAIRLDYGNGNVMAGAYVELDEPRRLAFTFGWEDPSQLVRPGGSLVEVELEPDGTGTVVRLTHTGLPGDEVATHTEGWDYFLPRLSVAVTG